MIGKGLRFLLTAAVAISLVAALPAVDISLANGHDL